MQGSNFLTEKDSPKASFQRAKQSSRHGYTASFKATKYGEYTAIAMIHVARMKKGHSFELMSGESRGNTTALNRSTAIRTRLWIDTMVETSGKNLSSLHRAWPREPLISQASA